MSLITDPLLQKLWKLAQAETLNERASAKLWTQLWNKHLFPEKNWVVSRAPPPSSNRQRAHVIIEDLGGASNSSVVLAFHEATQLNIELRDIEDAESWAHDACVSYLRDHFELEFVYAVTTFGTKRRAWKCSVREDQLQPLFGSGSSGYGDYVEVHSSEAQLIREAVSTIQKGSSCHEQ